MTVLLLCVWSGLDGNKSEIAVSSLDLKGNLCLGGTSSSPLSFSVVVVRVVSSSYPWLIFWPKQRTLWGPPTDALFSTPLPKILFSWAVSQAHKFPQSGVSILSLGIALGTLTVLTCLSAAETEHQVIKSRKSLTAKALLIFWLSSVIINSGF